jgi:hypothetical protein
MKLPRWLVLSMLAASELAILVVAGSWWVTWPERTFRKYHSLIRAGQIEAANSMFEGSDHSLKVAKPIYAGTYVYLKPASLLDLISARRVCKSRYQDYPVLYICRSKLVTRGPEGKSVFVCLVDE